ncbi:MAG: hypothetical protein IJF68_02090 [Opitutales bacterium]|nr:hypothetical protein [Opitutales bacterium]
MSRKQNHQNLIEQMHSKEWRALPQNVVLSGDTKSGKRQRVYEILRKFSVVLLVGGIASLLAYVWIDMMAGLSDEEKNPVAVHFENNGGLLDEAWFRAWTEFDENAAPNLHHLRDRLLAHPQISAARVLRRPDGMLRVDVLERKPVARLEDDDSGVRFVAADGVVFSSDAWAVRQSGLPILRDVRRAIDSKTGFDCVPVMAKLADFIETARTSYRKLFEEWDTISLRDFPSDERDIARPWSLISVVPFAAVQNPGHAKIKEYVFSATRFREDLKLLASARANGTWDMVLSAPTRAPAYRVLFITNRKNPMKEFREMRLIPLSAETP